MSSVFSMYGTLVHLRLEEGDAKDGLWTGHMAMDVLKVQGEYFMSLEVCDEAGERITFGAVSDPGESQMPPYPADWPGTFFISP
ncbi:MAG: hypothetical protein EOP86_27005 [Verrucomicrobiaceae bacterium]|nr:MAG: hypothetical protein EOP86_27005 [Verrucomicrobiaceae bacterium]